MEDAGTHCPRDAHHIMAWFFFHLEAGRRIIANDDLGEEFDLVEQHEGTRSQSHLSWPGIERLPPFQACRSW